MSSLIELKILFVKKVCKVDQQNVGRSFVPENVKNLTKKSKYKFKKYYN